ncbi:transmembrane protein, putative (macronuclear) [Tetrahymena thermophila SB210]|uniref:Transmembrane protein, putative n=1 Tax=Tetrahymena thermophila (strain SB210) TaxID=312017 RepID=I7M746_TETTS|nr:transmembrane protein, putative [Tetrahymena thermophila SB210]EAR89360.1 transmembrane protein, putative [Tetrahymena thermophila SB210]|eukprot:XP_001009605.1 transmembrane protein, putative [Tetrahymena thermophila SB210]
MRKIAILLIACTVICAASPLSNFINGLLGLAGTGNTQTVLASCFDDSTGMRDNDLYAGDYYAELSVDYRSKDFKALGGLPFGYKLRISYNGNSIIASKGDVGAGGPNHPKIDIHKRAAQDLGIGNCDGFLDNVQIEFLG